MQTMRCREAYNRGVRAPASAPMLLSGHARPPDPRRGAGRFSTRPAPAGGSFRLGHRPAPYLDSPPRPSAGEDPYSVSALSLDPTILTASAFAQQRDPFSNPFQSVAHGCVFVLARSAWVGTCRSERKLRPFFVSARRARHVLLSRFDQPTHVPLPYSSPCISLRNLATGVKRLSFSVRQKYLSGNCSLRLSAR